MRVQLDQKACFVCGLCADLCPAVFRVEGPRLRVLHDRVPREHVRACWEAATACPRAAIWVAEPPPVPPVP